MSRAFIMVCILCLSCAAFAADKPVDVRDLMTADQFHQAGLDKLSSQELAALNAWLAGYRHVPAAADVTSPATATAPAQAVIAAPYAVTLSDAKFGQEMLSDVEQGQPERIETRILGTFRGWTGESVFKLENGQVWQQAASGFYETRLKDPKVIIKKLGFGYLLTIPGEGATIFVKRLH